MDDIAGLPGGQVLATLARQVEGSPAAARDLASNWTRAARDAGEASAAVGAAASQVGQTWQGSSHAAFSDLMAQFGQASDATQHSLGNAAAAMDQVVVAFEQVQASIDMICQDLLSQVSQLRAASPGAPARDLDPQISSLVDQAVEEARAAIATFESALSRATGALSAELTGLGHASPTLPPAHNQGPSDGRDVGGSASGIGAGNGHVALDESRGPGKQVGNGQAVATPGGHTAAEATPGGASGAPPQVDAWINQAIRILGGSGTSASQLSPQDLWLIIDHESRGDPLAVNNWDSNAAAGTPSIGLMQTIQPTFDAFALPGHGDIRNPVDNIIAATRYALARYGSLGNVPGVVAVHNGRPYVGY